MAKDTETADLFEADGVTPKAPETKIPVITEAELKATERAARAEGEAAALKTVVAAKPETPAVPAKEFSRAQLRASVAAGDITEEQSDDIFEAQLEKRLTAKLEAKTVNTVKATDQVRTVQGEIDKYVEAHPDLVADGSELRAKVQGEFDYLVKLGDDPKDVATQLKAIRAAVGPLKPKGRAKTPESFEDTGGNGDGADRSNDAGWAKGLSAPQRKHYEKLINSGIYKGATDPKLLAEIKLVRKAH